MTRRPSAARAAGTVVEFDAEVGLGVVALDDGRALPFHCVEITDGSRVIAPGTPVWCRVVARLGADEAASLESRPVR